MAEVQQKDMFTRRWRKVRRLEPKELQIQIALIQHLKLRVRPGVMYFHVPNGETHDERAGAKLKAMGVLPGVADLVFVWNDDASIQQPCLRVLFLELKAKRGKESTSQIIFSVAVQRIGCAYRIACSLDDALAVLKEFDLLKF